MRLIKVAICCTLAGVAAAEPGAVRPENVERPADTPTALSNVAILSDATAMAVPARSRPAPTRVLLDPAARQISFQALLTNAQGNPIANPNGQHELDFRFYDSDAGGVPVGQVLDVLVTLNSGIASTQVGPIDPAWFNGQARWLGVTVDNGTEMTPLVALGTVPYAFRVDRVASEELDDDIALGDRENGGSMVVYSGDVQPVTMVLDGPNGRLDVGSPINQARMTIHGAAPLLETRDDSDTLIALFGYDAVGGGASCVLGTPAGTPGLILDGSANGSEGGIIQMYNDALQETISLSAANATLRVGSPGNGVSGNIHLYPTVEGPSRIHLDGQSSDLRLGLSAVSSGDLRLYSTSGGIETMHMDGNTGLLSLTNRTNETVRLDGTGSENGGTLTLKDASGNTNMSLHGDDASIRSSNMPLSLNGSTNQNVLLATGGGNVGIGTTQPNHELVIQGNDPAMQIRDDTTDNSADAARLELLERAGGNYNGGAFFWWNGETNKLLIGTKESGINTNVLVVDRATNSVGIGTQTPGNYRLAVNGSIRAKEIVVETGWSDFVFEPDYKLATLDEVEAHIGEHGHLPDIPSAKEVAAHGVKVGEMESKLLQKVEELTLHLIDMNKRLNNLECENETLRDELQAASREEAK